jgi:hypothetical protein
MVLLMSWHPDQGSHMMANLQTGTSHETASLTPEQYAQQYISAQWYELELYDPERWDHKISAKHGVPLFHWVIFHCSCLLQILGII